MLILEKRRHKHTSVSINRAEVEQVSSLRSQEMNITEKLSGTTQISTQVERKACKRLFILRGNLRGKLILLSACSSFTEGP